MVVALLNALLRGTSPWIYAAVMFLSNLALGWIALEMARSYSHREREKVEGVATT
jgi:threonine/homoserine/homoserine lactone efflux protein